ncbi:uncharacterized protein [Solanum lycopersicum]|uniref:uncharacterized protein n=1 Tax=Solanum lycopersicum TaxID=4081 RepID=UPI0037497D6C
MTPYEALYGRRCRYLVGSVEVGEAAVIGPNSVLYAMEKVLLIRDRLMKTQSRQKSYADVRRRKLEFHVDDWVAYELELPTKLEAVHPIFHTSLLKKEVGGPASIVPLESVSMKNSISTEDVPVKILDRQVRRLRNKEFTSVNVLWGSQSVERVIWEAEAAMKANYPYLFPSDSTQA